MRLAMAQKLIQALLKAANDLGFSSDSNNLADLSVLNLSDEFNTVDKGVSVS